MCRNIRVLHHFKPPSTQSEIHAAALQFVRKISGLSAPNQQDAKLLEQSAQVVAREAKKLLGRLPKRGEPRTREGERLKAQVRWAKREEQMMKVMKGT